MNIFLIGYRCTGKTTVGNMLAERLGWSFADTDRMVVETAGISISRMVAEKGWPFFRQREREALQKTCERKRQVVATGGGVVLDERNRHAMESAGSIVWLTASGKVIYERMRDDETTAGNRPPLTDQGAQEEIETVLAQRNPLYTKAADLVIDTDRKTVEEICDRIVEQVRIEKVGN